MTPQLLAPNEPVRIQWRPDDGGMPLKIKAICLPYVFAKAPTGHRRILDTGNKHGSVGNWQTTLTQNQGCCGFDSHLSYSSPLRSRGAAWSARLPVTQEVVGSNPIGNAFRCPASNSMALGIGGEEATCRWLMNTKRHGTQIGKAAKLKPWCLRVRLPPVLLEHASVGHWQAPLVVTQSSDRTLAVQTPVPAH